MTNIPIRHGDVNLISIAKLPKNLKEIKHNGEFVLAFGETTGHKHTLVVDRPELLKILEDEQGRRYIQLLAPAKLYHGTDSKGSGAEHRVLTIPAGIHFQVPEQEKDLFSLAVRKVVD